MSLKIKQDHARFKNIVRGRIKQNLKKFIQKGEMLGKRGSETVTIPVPTIDIPHFRYGHKEEGGVGQGDGEVGSAQTTTLIVSRIGFSNGVFVVAHRHAVLYGLGALSFAVAAGWAAGAVFRRV